MVRRNPRPRQHPVQRTGGNGGRDPGVHLCFRRHLHTEADLAEVEALINDETLLHVYLKPCGGEGYGVLMEKSPTEIWRSKNPKISKSEIIAHLLDYSIYIR